MLRRLSIAVVLALAGTSAGAQADLPGTGQTASRSAWVKATSCSRSEHKAVFYGRVLRRFEGQRMWMRFTLLERGENGRYAPVGAPSLKRWRKSKPGVKAFGYRQRVRGLSPDSAYRARVDYRWYDADGTLDRKARHGSGVCSQSGPLPNLRTRVTGSSATELPGLRRYTVRLGNVGEAAAEGAKLRFAVEGASSETKTVSYVAARDFQDVSFRAPACNSSVTAEADPGDELNETVETDNSQHLTCAQVPAH